MTFHISHGHTPTLLLHPTPILVSRHLHRTGLHHSLALLLLLEPPLLPTAVWIQPLLHTAITALAPSPAAAAAVLLAAVVSSPATTLNIFLLIADLIVVSFLLLL